MSDVRYEAGGSDKLDQVEALWLNLNQHHVVRSPHFSEVYASKTFDTRKKEILSKGKKGIIRTDLAYESETGVMVGYCISIIHADNVGEIESLVVLKESRGMGIGESLMQRSMKWMEEHKVKRKRLEVYFGNEEAFAFYKRFGFFPKYTVLEQIP